MPRRRSLSQAGIAEAALAVIDRAGLDALSMRTVAAELGVQAMALYRYVTDRRGMERLVADLVFSAIDPIVAQQGTWQRQVTLLARRARTAITAHPAVIPLLVAHHQDSPSAWRWVEALLSALTQAGLTSHQRVIAVRCLRAYVLGAAMNESMEPLAGPGTATLAALSPAAYPLIAETAKQALVVTPEQEFEQGLAIILQGLSATASRSC